MKNTILFLFLFITLISCSKQNKNESISDQLESAKNNIEKKNNEITIINLEMKRVQNNLNYKQ